MEEENLPGAGIDKLPAYKIKDLETIKALADPLRLRILELLREGPMTVKQVAAQLKTQPTKLYYHFNALEEHGFIRVVSTRIVSGIIEKQYHVAVSSIGVDPQLFQGLAAERDASVEMILRAVLGQAGDEIRESVRTGLIDLSTDLDAPGRRHFVLMRNLKRLTPEQADRVLALIESMLRETEALGSAPLDSELYGLVVAYYPMAGSPLAPEDFESGSAADGDANE